MHSSVLSKLSVPTNQGCDEGWTFHKLSWDNWSFKWKKKIPTSHHTQKPNSRYIKNLNVKSQNEKLLDDMGEYPAAKHF